MPGKAAFLKNGHAEAAPVVENPALFKIFGVIMKETGIDLRFYKSPTIRRRIARRISALKLKDADKYLAYLKTHPAEIQLLAHDVLIKVTNFFRDPEVFKSLCAKAYPAILKNRSADKPIRVWVPGCCTGEEVYSIAIAFLECLSAEAMHVQIQIFGTDVSEAVLDRARSGIYAARSVENISAERLEKFFTKMPDGYQIHKNVRAMCTFARQDLTQDPPFSKIDLISCRNVLIYLSADLQNKIFPIFHYALNPWGFLLLGKSETIGSFFPDLFVAADKRHNLYSKKASLIKPNFSFHFAPHDMKNAPASHHQRVTMDGEFNLQREVDRLLLSHSAPPAVLLNDSFEIVQSRGDLSPFLKIPAGKMSANVVKMAREGLAMELKLALIQAKKRAKPVRKRGVQIYEGKKNAAIDFEALPIMSPILKERYFLLIFQRASAAMPAPSGASPRIKPSDSRRIAQLKQELVTAKAYLQSIIEEHEATTQELKSANEEILSSNEELQSTNEELETAKEELESTNEEITTINEELEARNAELKDSFEKLRESQNDLREAQKLSHIGSWKWDLAANSLQWSDELCAIYGVRAGQVLNFDQFMNFLHPEDRATVKKILDESLENRQSFEFEHRIVRRDKSVRVLHARGHIVLDDAGRPFQMIGTGQDITDSKELREALTLTEERFRLMVESVQDYAIFMLDPNGCVTTWNIGAERLKGYRADEIIGSHFSRFYTREGREQDRPGHLLKIAAANGRAEDEGWRVRKDGTMFWANVVLTALKDSHGKLIGFVKVTRDMTERKQAEESLRRAYDTLDARVKERTAELKAANEELLIKADQVVRSNKELEQFAYVASHDLQEPLRKIMAFSERLKERNIEGLGDLERDYFERMQSAARRMKTLIEDLLNFSRVTTKESLFERVDLKETFKEVQQDLEERIRQTSAVIDIGELPVINANPMQMRQLFLNLIGNSLKFAKKNEPPHIAVRSRQIGNEVEITVRDNGIGFDEKYLDRIFKPFQRLHGRSDYEGTGIGLAICQKIVQRHNGQLTAQSRPGEGSTFIITLSAI